MRWYKFQSTYGPLFHGSRVKGLSEFDLAFEGTGVVSSGISSYGGVFFFTNDKRAAEYYADPKEGETPDEYVTTAYVTMRNPYVVEDPDREPRYYIKMALLMSTRFNDDDLLAYGDDNKGWYYVVSDESSLSPRLEGGPFGSMDEAMRTGYEIIRKHNIHVSGTPYDGIILKGIIDGDVRSDVYVPFSVGQIRVLHG